MAMHVIFMHGYYGWEIKILELVEKNVKIN